MFKYNALLFLLPVLVMGQVEKQVNEQTQSWVSINTVTKFNDHWGAVVDFHIRTNEILESNSFYFLRGGIRYFVNPKINLTAGYAELWLAPTKENWTTYSDEKRIYQQFQWSSSLGKVNMLQRIRNEQRWVEKIVKDIETGEYKFTNRVRFLLSFNFPIFKSATAPKLVLSDELLVQFGKEVVFNTFDQNRLFIGFVQPITSKLSCDFGYMNVYQQKSSGYQYDLNHTLRLFFYFNTSVSSHKAPKQITE